MSKKSSFWIRRKKSWDFWDFVHFGKYPVLVWIIVYAMFTLYSVLTRLYMVLRANYEKKMSMLVLIFNSPYFVLRLNKIFVCKRRLFYKCFNFNDIIIYSQVSEAELNWNLILINFLGVLVLGNYTKISFFSFRVNHRPFVVVSLKIFSKASSLIIKFYERFYNQSCSHAQAKYIGSLWIEYSNYWYLNHFSSWFRAFLEFDFDQFIELSSCLILHQD